MTPRYLRYISRVSPQVGTVDGFQGQEKEAIVISMVRDMRRYGGDMREIWGRYGCAPTLALALALTRCAPALHLPNISRTSPRCLPYISQPGALQPSAERGLPVRAEALTLNLSLAPTVILTLTLTVILTLNLKSQLRALPGQQSKPRSPSRAAGPLTHLHRTESQQRKTTQPRALCRLILFIVSE